VSPGVSPAFPSGAGLVVDLFAGGGGASTGIEAALGRPVDLAKFAAHVHVPEVEGTCWTWTGPRLRRADGSLSYGTFSLGKRNHRALAHRVAFMLAHGAIARDQVVCHRCDNPPCVRPDHLFLGTQAENLADMRAKGRGRTPGLTGAAHPQAKLDEDGVREVRRLRAEGLSFVMIGARVGLHPSTCHAITSGRLWRHVS
jgi:hypothetical protein